MKFIFTLLCFYFSLNVLSQELTANQLLENAITYHDPNTNWPNFNDTLTVVMTTPNSPKRSSSIRIDLPNEFFSVKATRDTITTTYTLNKGKCQLVYNGEILDSTKAEEKDMDCDRATLYKNYYSYLYGLPMKLRDDGTNLNPKVEKKTFKGKDYLVVKVTYDQAVGSDIWYFYFNPTTYAMEIYQFFKTDVKGKEKPNSGEYILLSEEAIVNGIKMPKIRAWYYNKNDKYLGTDSLVADN